MTQLETLSDEELVTYVRTKDTESYREVVMRYQSKLLRYADRLLKDQAAASDIVQQAFIKAYKNLNGFDTSKKFSSWIYRIVHNESINYIKKNKRNVRINDEGLLDRLRTHYRNETEQQLERKELVEMVNSLVEELPIEYRAPLVLFYIEDKSYNEISDVLRIPIGTVGTRINRGKRRLMDIYSKQHE